jgi:hypothetical protein
MNSKWWENEPLRIIEVCDAFEDALGCRTPEESAAGKKILNGNVEHLHVMNMGKGCGLTDTGLYFRTDLAGVKNRDYLAEYLPEAKRAGLRTVIYFNVHAVDPEFARQHPDWLQTREDGSPIDTVYSTAMSFCINSGFRDWCFQILRDLCAYDIDGIFYDGPIFFSETCYCESCRRKYRENYGGQLPSKADRKGKDFPTLVEFQSRSLADFLHDSDQVIKDIDPGILLYMNGGLRAANWPTGRMNRTLIEDQDILGSEGGFLYRDLRSTALWKPGCEAKLLETQAAGKPTVIFNCLGHKNWNPYPLPDSEARLLYASTLANGANAWFAIFPTNLNPAETRGIAETNKVIAENPQCFINTESVANIALVWSNANANHYEAASIAMADFTGEIKAPEVGDVRTEFDGFYDALVRSHAQFDVVDEVTLQRPAELQKYQLLILPNIACLSEKDAANLREYVRAGGKLLATFETSLYNGVGRRLPDFRLKDVFGVQSGGNIFGPMGWDYVSSTGTDALLDGLKREWLPAPKYGLSVKNTDGKVLMKYHERLAGRYDGQPGLSDDPLLITHGFGEGESVYIAGTWGDSTWKYRFTDYHRLIANLAKTRTTSLLGLSDHAGFVEATLRKKNGQNAWLVHLVNFTGEMKRPIDRVTPVRDLRITLHGVPGAETAKALVAGTELETERRNGSLSCVLPELNEYEVIEIVTGGDDSVD